jgi:hypothetical protein
MIMGNEVMFIFCVKSKTFVPTQKQLLGIVALLQESGIIDATEQERLEQEIKSTYPTRGPTGKPVNDPNEDSTTLYEYEYNLASTEAFPFFQTHGNYQTLEIYKGVRNLGASCEATRFSIAVINDIIADFFYPEEFYIGGEESFYEATNAMKNDPVLAPLRERVERLLGVPVVIDGSFT